MPRFRRASVSTSDGVKAIDVAWLPPERREEVRGLECERGTLKFYFPATPEIRHSSEMCPEFPPHTSV